MLLRLRNYLTGASAVETAVIKELRAVEDRFLIRVSSLEQRLTAAEAAVPIVVQRVAASTAEPQRTPKSLSNKALRDRNRRVGSRLNAVKVESALVQLSLGVRRGLVPEVAYNLKVTG